MGEGRGGEVGGDVAVVVEAALDLVEELGGAGFDGDEAAGTFLFGDDDAAIGSNFGNWVADTRPLFAAVGVLKIFEASEVSAADIIAAFD